MAIISNYGESREQLPPSYTEKVSDNEDLNVKCEICHDDVYIFDTQKFYHYQHVCNFCVNDILEKNRL